MAAAGATFELHGYVLHLRPYREAGALCDLFSRERGRITAVAHGVRGRRGSSAPAPFCQHVLLLAGRGELRTLRRAEPVESRWLEGTALAAGLYLNELLVRLLHREDPHEALFDAYAAALEALPGPGLEAALRVFEGALLDALGYGVPFDVDARGAPVERALRYRLEPGEGFVADVDGPVDGATLQAIAGQDFTAPEVRRAARRLYNALLAPHLDGRPIQSRMLLRAPGAQTPGREADD